MAQVIDFAKQLYRRINDADTFGLSAQLSYFFLLSLFPFLLFLMTLVGYLPLDEQVFLEFIEVYAPAEIMDLINTTVSDLVNAQNGKLLSIGIIGTLWSASNGVNAITKAFNRAYNVEEDRFYLYARFIAIGLTVAMIGVIVIAFLLPIFGKVIGVYIFSFVGLSDDFLTFWNTLRWVISSVVFFLVFLFLYKLAPNLKLQFKDAIWGALFSMAFWQLTSLGFSYYVNTMGNYSATYGSLGTIIVLMIWFYMTGVIIIIGGVINSVILNNKSEEK